MGVPTIALYASSSGSVCSASHQISSHVSFDLDVNGRSTSTASASPAQKSFVGGLSCLFSSPQIKSSSSSSGGEELGSQWHDRSEKLGSSYRYSSLSSSLKRDQLHQSPVSVLQGFDNSVGSGSRASPPLRTNADLTSIRSTSGGIFNGFVRNTLQMDVQDVDWCSPSIALPIDDLTFNMDDELDLPSESKDLLSDVQSRHSIFRDDFVVKAFYLAEKAHRGQKRASGHPYLNHCVETALLLANIGATSTVVAAGLLHDTIDDSLVTYDDISASLGTQVGDLVKGVSKLSQLSKLARENDTASKTVEADRLHTMFLAMADARAVMIKLADRLHNMLTLDALPLNKQQRISKETLEIFVPLANRLGIWTWKDELENLCFKYLYPDHHEELRSFVESFDKSVISSSSAKLKQALKTEGISFHSLSGRHKSLYSIYCKMMKKKLSIDEIHDIYGLRLIVENEEDCYKALKVVQLLWHEVPGKFKDYIIHPKFNGYQSLHTVVESEGMIPLEVQIRTKEMHLQAEYGLAAHWRYKEGGRHPSFVLQMVEWARWVVSWQCEEMCKEGSSIGFVDLIKPQCTFPAHSKDCSFSCNLHSGQDGRIFVILLENDKMSVQEFPADSSMIDLLETNGRGSCMGTSLSNAFHLKEELMPRLNHKPVVDPSRKLKMGDVVELTPAIPSESLTVYRKEIQRMYNNGGGLQPRPVLRTVR